MDSNSGVFHADSSTIQQGVIQLHVLKDDIRISYADVIRLWDCNLEFATFFIHQLALCPFSSFKWETPPVTTDTLDQPFECVLLNAPYLGNRRPDPIAFSMHLKKSDTQNPAATFSNLGGDAILIAPLGISQAEHYIDLAAFSRNAPQHQQVFLWKCVSKAMEKRIGTQPVWLSTAGGGVAWLHVRLDDRPKYYGYAPYRN